MNMTNIAERFIIENKKNYCRQCKRILLLPTFIFSCITSVLVSGLKIGFVLYLINIIVGIKLAAEESA